MHPTLPDPLATGGSLEPTAVDHGRRHLLWSIGAGVVLAGGTALGYALTRGGTGSGHGRASGWPGAGTSSRPAEPTASTVASPPASHAPGTAPQPLWRISLNRASQERPVLAAGKVLVKANVTKDATEIADLQAYDQAKGTLSWTYPGVAALDVTHAYVAGNHVVMREEMGTVLVLDPATGRKSGDLGPGTGVYVLVVEATNGNTVYTWGTYNPGGDGLANSAPATVAAWDATTNQLLWHQPGLGTLAVVQPTYLAGQGPLVFSVDIADHVTGRDPATGKALWDVNIGSEPGIGAKGVAFNAVSEPLGLFFTTRRKTVAWDARTGAKRWGIEPSTPANHFGNSLLSPDGRTLYTTELGPANAVMAVDAATGKVLWRASPGALRTDGGAIALCGPDVLAVPAASGTDGFWVLSTSDGSHRWSYSEPGTTTQPWDIANDPAATVVAALQGNTLVVLPLQ
ncbi:PQQ-binding-like beta-propeller repeat protein [Streptacidiphilus jiangxiensis]|uniref:outer membrane protein assembly factor BamB family protein n=1 Tax=Streptacidiphilus jiangxiensis TaxID=235985 RepID=UPI0005A7EBE6|nr:PQQ-binding-like beta-propeller repeat protein [Streptacidiphilus jiangxiensis]